MTLFVKSFYVKIYLKFVAYNDNVPFSTKNYRNTQYMNTSKILYISKQKHDNHSKIIKELLLQP